jgi:hypothetical protein
MNPTLIVAIYGAVVSSVLAAISIFNFLRERRVVVVEYHLSLEGNNVADYDFVISNVSSRAFTLIDCMLMNIAKTEEGKLEPDWGIEPYVLKSLYGDRKTKKLVMPHTLQPGEILIIGTDTKRIVEQFSFYSRTPVGSKKWTPTTGMWLEVSHSMSKKYHRTKFKLEEDELQRLQSRKPE